jgi:SAM-dependent methyltransferase
MKSSTAPSATSTSSRDNESYGAFAYAYDKALGDRFFRAVSRVLTDVVDKYPTPMRTHLDVACGTGLVIEFFAKRGFKSVGVDASLPMLRMAAARTPRLAAADFRALPFRSKFARITCLYDSLNHLKDRAELTAAFRAVRRVLTDDGLFLFDMNHPDIYPEIWGMKQPYVASGADYHLEIATKYRRREKIGQALVSGWALLPNGERAEIHEKHEQRAYTEREIVQSLGDAGLKPRDVIDFDPYDEAGAIDAEGVKLFFVAGT